MLTLRRKSSAKSRWTYYSSADNGDTESDYDYDANGNRDFGEDSVGAGNRLAFDNTWSYSYDNEGNLIKRVNITETEDAGLTWTYDYDNANHLTVAKEWDVDPDEHEEATLMLEADYAYDVFGNRIQKTVDWDGEGEETAEVEKYAYDGWNNLKSSSPVGTENWDIFADLDDAGSLATRYVRGDVVDQLFARVANNGDTLWNLTDHLGSLRDVIDNDGNVLDTINYSAFGQIDESDPEYGGRYKWTGREADVETGLQFNRARYYDADTGRWISQDPLGFDAGDSNLYRYVANRPVQWSDPSGKQTITVPNRAGYGGYPKDLHEFYAITIDMLLSGSPYAGNRKMSSSGIGLGAFGLSYFDKMEDYCTNTLGQGWTPLPIEFRLTKLELADTSKEGFEPRFTKKLYVPVLYQTKGAQSPSYKMEEITPNKGAFPMVHFNVEGIWVFKGVQGKKESKLFGFKTSSLDARARFHTPYDKSFASAFADLWSTYSKKKANKEIDWYYIGRPYDRKFALGMSEDVMLKWNGGIYSYLKISPGDTGADLTLVN